MAKQWTLLPADSKVAPPVQGLASVITSSFVPESFNAGSNGGSILSFGTHSKHSQTLESCFSNDKILSVMTLAYMQNGDLPNGTVVVSDSARPQWVVQKFGGECAHLHSCLC